MIFIFGLSNEGGNKSSSLSLRVTVKIVDIIDYGADLTEEEYDNLVEKLHNPVRKAAHMTEYAILAMLICTALAINVYVGNIKLKGIKQILLVSLAICMIYAAADEMHQLFISGRSGKITDVFIDTAGAICALSVFLCIYKLANGKIICKRKQ